MKVKKFNKLKKKIWKFKIMIKLKNKLKKMKQI